jgi:RNA polymerase sigma-70 factor (ECF subfamily)
MNFDDEQLREIIKLYTTPVYNFIAQILSYGGEAEDATQETFIKVWKNLKKFDTTKKFKPWLFQIAKNTALDYRRRQEPTRPFIFDQIEELDELESIPDFALTPLEQLELKQQAQQVQQAIIKLPNIYRVVLNLYYQEELSLAEIATVLDEPVDTVKSRHRRALLKLRQLLLHP